MAHLLRKYVIAPTVCWGDAILLVLAVCFLRGVEDVAPYKHRLGLVVFVGAITYLRSKCAMKRSEILNRPP